ncbi:MAG: ABC transporter ATP-binding protein [Pseudomonadota bacterium]|nr:ABC transporter ATP-binding protein [Rubrivivax sp.]NLZ40578.1 ABC transporter ATP-binding protein [Comamonadaceae bacterium]
MALLETRGLARRFGGIQAVRDASLAVEAGEIFAIIGPNGAGKTTLFNLVSRVYPADAGQILLAGEDITRIAPHRVAALGVARTFQNIELFERSTVLDNLLVGRHCRGRAAPLAELLFTRANRRAEVAHRDKVERIIELLELQAHRDTSVGALAYGVRKVVEIGRALAAEPRLLLLDEPSSGLNAEETEDLSFWIRDIRDDFGITVVMIEHDMRLVDLVSDRVLAMDRGAVLAVGAPAAIMADARVVEAYLGG